ncbi:MAG TPA: hypothetical protein VFB62_20415, partial [Polyangiaceae bacterium]|nr:hypothetical protein [Polyangiaceae bacterium]
PARRYQTGGELVEALDRALLATMPPPPAPKPRIELTQADLDMPLERPRSRAVLWSVLIVLTGAAAVSVYFARERYRAAQVAPPPTATASAEAPKKTEVDGLGAGAWTARLLAAPASRDWQGGAKALVALAELDSTVLRDPEVAKAAMAVAVETTRGAERAATADEVFELLAKRFGGHGLDVLYDISESRRSPDAQKRANAWFRQPDIIGPAPAALKITVELREAPCEEKSKKFDRAVAVGDKRTLAVLQSLRTMPCRGAKDPCCFVTNKELGEAIKALQARVKP